MAGQARDPDARPRALDAPGRGGRWWPTWLLAAAVLGLAVVSLGLGQFPLAPRTVMTTLWSAIAGVPSGVPAAATNVVMDVRLPRVVAAMLVGASLAVAGAAYQTLFRNPLASPAILGVSAGAGFGAALGFLLQAPSTVVQASAFVFGLVAVVTTIGLAGRLSDASPVNLILVGMVVAAIFQALIAGLKFLADPIDALPTITFWLLGSLSRVTMEQALVAMAPSVIGAGILYLWRWQINIAGLPEEEARTLGVESRRLRLILIAASTLLTSAAVSVAGIVGWIGLLVPHMARMLVGSRFQDLLPVSALIGASFLLLIDDVCRGATSTEMPLGIVTALIGAPVFLHLLGRVRVGWF